MKRILSTILILAMMLSVMPVISMAEVAADAPYADSVGEIPENLIIDPANSSFWYSNPTYVNSTTVQTKNEWKGNSYAGYAFKTTAEVKASNGWQIAAGSRLLPKLFNEYIASEGEHYVIKFAVRSLTDGVGFGIRVGTWNGAFSGNSTDVSQIMGYEDGIAQVPGDGEWSIVQGTLPALRSGDINPENNMVRQIVVGMAVGTPANVTAEFNNHYSDIPEGVPYFAKESAVEINLESDTDIAEPGSTVALTAEILNQLGLVGGLDQGAINWYVTDADRTQKITKGFEFDGSNLSVTAAAEPGTYAIVAESSENDSIRKGVELTVLAPVKEDYVPAPVPAGQPYDITLTRTSEDRDCYTALNELTLSAALVDENGSADGLSQDISWIVLETEKRNELEDGIELVANGGDATVTFDAALAEGSYYIRAYKTGDIMMGRNFEVVIDNEQILKDILKELNEDTNGTLKENLPKYLPYIDAGNTFYEKTDKDNLDTVIKAMVDADEGFTSENLADNFELACILSLHNVPSEDVILNNEDGSFVYAKELGLDTVDDNGATLYADVYVNTVNDAGKAKVIAAVCEAQTKADAIATFAEATLLAAISDTDQLGTSYVTELLTKENLATAGVEAKGYLASDAKELYEDEIAHKELTKSALEKILKNEYTNEDEEEEDDDDDYKPSRGGSGGVSVAGPSVSVATPPAQEEAKTEEKDINFNDLPASHWAFVNIQFLAKLDVLKGDENGNFNPEKPVTREEFVKILVEAFDLGGTTAVNFGDVSTSAWYAPYVEAAVASGVIAGKADGSFGVGEAVTREDMCVMIARVLNMGQDAEGSVLYADADDIAPYAKNSVGYLSMLSMINGMPDNTFRPKDACTRAQAARVIADILNYNVMEVNGK